MGRSLRLAHLPAMNARLRFSGYLTHPSITDAQVQAALSTYLGNLTLWRNSAQLPSDWPTRDDSMIQDPPQGGTAIWGEGTDFSSATTIGDPETPWRLLVGQGQLAIDNVWLYDPKADPWPDSIAPCPTPFCPPSGGGETITPPAPRSLVPAGIVGALLGAGATAAVFWWRRA